MLRQSAEQLAWMAAQRAYTLWQEKKFRQLVSFDHLDRTEQDRIFNELEVTVLGALDLFFEWQATRVTDKNDHDTFIFIKDEIPEQFVQILKKQGVANTYVKIWHQLISLRLNEYRDNFKDAHMMTANWKQFKHSPAILKPVWTRVQTLAISSWQHIRRGKNEEGDPLWPILRDWLVDIYAELMALMDAFVLETEKRHQRQKKIIN